MNTGARLGLTVTAGYLLGRFHKMKWALAIAAMASRGRQPSGPGGLLQQGVKALSSSPELAELTDEMKGRLVDAGKAAAVAAVSSKINSLTDGLRERSDAMRAASAGGNGGAEEEEEDVEDERHRDEDRAADSGRKSQPDEDDDRRVPVQRRPGSRGESELAHAGRQSRGREDTARQGRASHPSRHSGDGDGARSGARQRQDDRRTRPRSPASRTGGGSK